MPRIREIIAEPSRQNISFEPGGRRAQASDFDDGGGSQAAANALGQLGSQLIEIGIQTSQNRAAAKLAKAVANATAEIQQYGFSLKEGSMDEAGNWLPPPDSAQAPGLYAQKVQEIRQCYQEELGDDYFAQFDSRLAPIVQRQGLGVQQHAIDVAKSEAKADMEEALLQLPITAARANNLEHGRILKEGRDLIDRMEQGGLISPEAAAKKRRSFNETVTRAAIDQALSEGGDAARSVIKQLRNGLPADMGLTAQEQQSLLRRAVGQVKKDTQVANEKSRQMEQAGRDWSKKQKDQWLSDVTALEGERGPRSSEDVKADRYKYPSEAAYRTDLKAKLAAENGQKGGPNTHLLELEQREDAGKLDEGFVDDLYEEGKLTTQEWSKYRERAKSRRGKVPDPVDVGRDKVKGAVSRVRRHVSQGDLSEATGAYDEQVVEFSQQNGRAPNIDEANQIFLDVERRLNQKDGVRRPRFYDGSLDIPDTGSVDAAFKKLQSEYEKGNPDIPSSSYRVDVKRLAEMKRRAKLRETTEVNSAGPTKR